MNQAHSFFKYILFKIELAKLDRDIQANAVLREMVIAKEITFAAIKKIYLKKMERLNKLFCIYCQKPLKIYTVKGNLPEDMATIEHVIPLSEGGLKYHESNFACACPKCNNKRKTLPVHQISETQYTF